MIEYKEYTCPFIFKDKYFSVQFNPKYCTYCTVIYVPVTVS